MAVDFSPADFVCLVTYDAESGGASVGSISGTHTPLFSQINSSARRTEPGWNPSITASSTANAALRTVLQEKIPHQATAREFMEGVIEQSLIDSTFAQFNDYSCYGLPIIIDDFVYGALLFVIPDRFTKPQEESCRKFVDQCISSDSSMMEEQRLTEQIDELTEKRRRIQTNDPLGLTQRNGSAFRTPRSFGDIHLSVETQTAVRGDRELKLTRREFDLLHTFLQNPETALSRVQIVSRVWIERNGISSNVLNVTVKNLREKLEADGEPRVIHSLRAYGYVLKAEAV
ncbi:MAG: winged helix-turn-helix domain-containing protein [Dehalococcoidia bacterium]